MLMFAILMFVGPFSSANALTNLPALPSTAPRSATAQAPAQVWQEPIEWYGGDGTMSGVRRVAGYTRDQATCDSDAAFEHVFAFDVPTTIAPTRFRWWALNVDTDQQLKALYGTTLPGTGVYSDTGTAKLCMEDLGVLPGGAENVRTQLRLSWTAPEPATRTALLVIGGATPTAGDTALRTQLERDGFGVTVVEDVNATTEAAAASHLVIIAASATPADVNTKFRDTPVPVVVLNSELFDDMGMTSSTGASDNQTQVVVNGANSPITSGITGTVTVLNQPGALTWGRPSEAGVKAATLSNDTNAAVAFSYAPATTMVGQAAPARRVGLGYPDATIASLAPDGLQLLTNATNWAAFPALPPAGSGAIAGQVIANNTNVGIADIEICATPGTADNTPWRCDYYAFTNAAGEYRISGLAPGSYHVFPIPPSAGQTLFPRNVFVTVGTGEAQTSFVLIGESAWTKTEEIAHRGDRVTSPENTMEAFKRSVEKGSSYIELDVLLASDTSVLVAHGSRYQDEPGAFFPNPRDPIQSVLSQVYGPTEACFERNLEVDDNVPFMRQNCDIGTEMMILPGQKLGTTWQPKFRNERYQTLDDVLRAFPNYCGWMIELKETEYPDIPVDREERNRLLGVNVQNILKTTGTLDRCGNDVWVTSFEDSALGGVTDGRIQRMRTISALGPQGPVPLLMWQQWIDFAASRGYDAVNVPVQSLDTRVNEIYVPIPPKFARPGTRPVGGVTINYGPTLSEYVHRTGLRLSTYSLTGAPPATPFEITPDLNQKAIDGKADFFMTDIIDDLMVRNGDRNPAHTPKSTTVQQNERVIVRNEEVFETNVFFDRGSGSFDSSLTLPGDSWFIGTFDNGALTGQIIYPTYYEPYFEPVYKRQNASVQVNPSGQIALIAKHSTYENVEPKLALYNLGRDTVAFNANDVIFPQPDRSNPAITGTECSGPNEQNVKNIALSAKIEIPPGDAGNPQNQWTLGDVQVYLDGELFGQANGNGGISVTIPATGPVVKDLPAGPHVFTAIYTATNVANPAITRQVLWPETFEAKLKPCLNNADIALVFDESGSIGSSNYQLMKSFGISLTDALSVTTTATNIGLVKYSDGAEVVAGLSGDPTQIKSTIQGMSYDSGGTNTADGIRTGQGVLAGGRADRPNVLIVLTDGTSDAEASRAAADEAKASGTTVIAVGIGAGPDNAELRGMASSIGLVFTPGRFEDLIYVLEALVPADKDPIP
jgi:glycerophosphoryl diester phosphodiesterase